MELPGPSRRCSLAEGQSRCLSSGHPELTCGSAKVMIADMNKDAAQAFADELNKMGQVAWVAQVNVMDWDQQVKAFESAVKEFGRVDYVYPIAGIGERAWTPPNKNSSGFTKPDLSVIEADLIGVLYTVSLAVQQFRRQEKDSNGFRGKSKQMRRSLGIYTDLLSESVLWPPSVASIACRLYQCIQLQSSRYSILR